ncbi:MAG: hypothetical protein SGJ20_12965, partial [Planctomycetota bacterium]|nr:hypothetical protein [Planctomycetota bacterium]
WEVARAQLHLKALEALEICVDSPRAALQFVKLHTDLVCQERRLRLEEEQLAEEKREHERYHERELHSRAVEQAREENRAAELRWEAARSPVAGGSRSQSKQSIERARPRGEFSARRQAVNPFVKISPLSKVA